LIQRTVFTHARTHAHTHTDTHTHTHEYKKLRVRVAYVGFAICTFQLQGYCNIVGKAKS
jgi:hypothetical protein